MRIFIQLTEVASNLLADFLSMIGSSTPLDGCECIYVKLNSVITIVFQLVS